MSSCQSWLSTDYTKDLSDIKWTGENVVVPTSKLLTNGVYRAKENERGNGWWWKFYDDGSCIMFYVDSVVKNNGKIDFEKTYLAGEDSAWDSTYNKPGIFKLCNDTVVVNVYSSSTYAYSFDLFPWNGFWVFAKVRMTIVDSNNLLINNDVQNNNESLHLQFVPCVNMVEVDRIKVLKDMRWMWTKGKNYNVRKRKSN